jgi:N-acetylglutamate synthase-like GNAT family acetyltransferase
LQFQWLNKDDNLETIVDFFISNTDGTFISHGEIQCGRAPSLDGWSSNLHDVLLKEMRSLSGQRFDTHCRQDSAHCLLALDERDGQTGELCAIVNVAFQYSQQAPVCILDDIIVNAGMRGRGIGIKLFRELERICDQKEIAFIFLESGAKNEVAHEFFDRVGCTLASFHYVKPVTSERRGRDRRRGQVTQSRGPRHIGR